MNGPNPSTQSKQVAKKGVLVADVVGVIITVTDSIAGVVVGVGVTRAKDHVKYGSEIGADGVASANDCDAREAQYEGSGGGIGCLSAK